MFTPTVSKVKERRNALDTLQERFVLKYERRKVGKWVEVEESDNLLRF